MGVEGPFPVVVGMASRLAINPSSCRESRRAKSSSTFSKKEFEKLAPLGWEAEMDSVKAVGTAKAEGKPIAFKEKPEITSTVRFNSKCSNIEESKVAADVHESAGDAAAAGSTEAKKFADGDECLVVSHTPVKAGKGDEAAANVMAGFSKTRRRLNLRGCKATPC